MKTVNSPELPHSPWHLVWTRIAEAADDLRRTRAEAGFEDSPSHDAGGTK